MPKPEKLDRKEIIDAIKKYHGKVAFVAQSLSVSTATIYNYVNKYSTVKAALDDAQNNWDEGLLDTAESKLQKAVNNGDVWAIRYILNTKGKKRGYGEKNNAVDLDDRPQPIKVIIQREDGRKSK